MEQLIIKQCLKDNRAFPEKIQNAPDILLGLNLFYSAFIDLDSCRHSGYEDGPIPWTAIADYCAHKGITGETADDMFFHVRSLDKAFLKHRSDKAKKELSKTDSKGKRNG